MNPMDATVLIIGFTIIGINAILLATGAISLARSAKAWHAGG